MKILSAEQTRKADLATIQNEPIDSIDLMERASKQLAYWVLKNLLNKKKKQVSIFCGLGNNGGDGLALARLLAKKSIPTKVFIVRFSENTSPDFKINLERLKTTDVEFFDIYSETDVPKIEKGIIVDALFGSGLSRPISGICKTVINDLNKSNCKKVSIDIPSGLYCDLDLIPEYDAVIKADYTLTFQFPKLSFMLAQNSSFVGFFKVLNIGLDKQFIKSQNTQFNYLTNKLINKWTKSRAKFSHKGTFGHALFIGGSYGKLGAAVLSSKACLRSGVGLLTSFLPKCGYTILQTAVPEAMCVTDENEQFISKINTYFSKYSAIGIGPGLGTEKETQQAFKQLLDSNPKRLVIDADAINILAKNKAWIKLLPVKTILTPHPKEFDRLFGESKTSYERLQKQIKVSLKHNIIIVLKGAHTSISLPNGKVYFNSTGNAGMATGGSGDVLTGIILAYFAQGYSPKKATLLGVYNHGKAGDKAAKKRSQQSMIATDIIEELD